MYDPTAAASRPVYPARISRLALNRTGAPSTGSMIKCSGHTNFTHLVDTNDPAKARHEQHVYFGQVMGTHRSHTHLEESYIFGTIDEIVARLRDLQDAGCEYIVLGPTSDNPAQLDLLHDLIIPQVNG